uniref:Uncharacterized protein n=1 Tax=Oryza meridionalis TaxID=40149 RepID=A0A0E0EJ01_9ORYZ
MSPRRNPASATRVGLSQLAAALPFRPSRSALLPLPRFRREATDAVAQQGLPRILARWRRAAALEVHEARRNDWMNLSSGAWAPPASERDTETRRERAGGDFTVVTEQKLAKVLSNCGQICGSIFQFGFGP